MENVAIATVAGLVDLQWKGKIFVEKRSWTKTYFQYCLILFE